MNFQQYLLDLPRIVFFTRKGGVGKTSIARGSKEFMAKNDLHGTTDLLIPKTLSQMDSLHGYGIVLHVPHASDQVLQVEQGALHPALHRMPAKWLAVDEELAYWLKRRPSRTGPYPSNTLTT